MAPLNISNTVIDITPDARTHIVSPEIPSTLPPQKPIPCFLTYRWVGKKANARAVGTGLRIIIPVPPNALWQ